MLQARQHPLTAEEIDDFFARVPKVELHTHLGGSVDPSFAFEALKGPDQKMHFHEHTFKSSEQLDWFLRRPVDSLDAYLDKYKATRGVFNDLGNIYPLIRAMVGQYAKQNTKALEIRTALKSLDRQSGADTFPSYKPSQEIQAYIDAIKRVSDELRIKIGLILCIRRGNGDIYQKAAGHTLEVAKDCRKDGVVGIDLVGKEHGNEAQPFAHIFRKAKEDGLGTTVHAGEACHEGSIRQALVHCLVDRIGHGTSLIRHSEIYERVRNDQIPLELCPTSNVDCKALCAISGEEKPISSLADHPFKQFYVDGLLTTINVDNLVVSNTTLANELKIAYQNFGLSLSDIARIIRHSARASFAFSEEEKTKFNQELDQFMDRYAIAA